MPTKTEYRAYIASAEWRVTRKVYLDNFGLACNRCFLPRWLAIIAYDQDLHVHHLSYARVGRELNEDLEPLCRRCHEIETFCSSLLHKPQCYICQNCGMPTFNSITRWCEQCSVVTEMCRRIDYLKGLNHKDVARTLHIE